MSAHTPSNRPLALITGGSSGIGAGFARRFAEKGCDVHLVARRENQLRELSQELHSKHGVTATWMSLELTKPANVEKLLDYINSSTNLEFLINNAGGGREDSRFLEGDIQDHLRMLALHDEVPLRLAHAAARKMRDQGKGVIVNVSSIAGYLMGPAGLMYYATKSFLTSASESLALELAPHGVKIQALCPGFTRTDFHEKIGWKNDDPRYKKFMTVPQVISHSFKCLEKNRVICIPGFKNRLLVRLTGLLPRKLLYYAMTRYHRKQGKPV